jgi:cysteine desulfurase family protein (TIGR01976 family)
MSLDPQQIRTEFPALASGSVFFDNPGGTQVPRAVPQAISRYLRETNANHGGAFPTSRASDSQVDAARAAFADFVHARRPEEIVFGANMTSLTFSLSRSLAAGWQPGDEIVVTRLDHDANITPWTLAAAERGVHVRWVDVDVEDCTLRLDELEGLLSARTRLVAVGYASNSVGTINPLPRILEAARQAGAWTYVDAVQFAPHGPIDVQDLGCDFLVMSAYKFFGPHAGILYGRYDRLAELPAYRVRPAPADPPGKFETGTPNFEGIVGAAAALEYLAEVGRSYGAEHAERYSPEFSGRALHLKQAMAAIRAYEMELSRATLEMLAGLPGVRVWGISDLRAIDRRVPTVSFTVEGKSPRAIAEALGRVGINVWDGNYYAQALSERLGVEAHGGMVRVGSVHYNTLEEIQRLAEELRKVLLAT